jgi:hypothetical protein
MRGSILLLGAALILSLGMKTQAQFASGEQASKFFTGVDPRNVKTVPVDTSKAFSNLKIQPAFRPRRPPAKPFALNKFFPKMSFPSWAPAKANTTQNPFQTIPKK